MRETETDPRETKDDLGMMRRADLWPLRPWLPVKRKLKHVETGILGEDRHGKAARPVVRDREGGTIAEYDDLEALVADGWVVD